MKFRLLLLIGFLIFVSSGLYAQSRNRAIRNPSRTSGAQAAYGGNMQGQGYTPKKKKKSKSKKVKMKNRKRDSGKSGMNLLYRKD
jgi:hypothetical protein